MVSQQLFRNSSKRYERTSQSQPASQYTSRHETARLRDSALGCRISDRRPVLQHIHTRHTLHHTTTTDQQSRTPRTRSPPQRKVINTHLKPYHVGTPLRRRRLQTCQLPWRQRFLGRPAPASSHAMLEVPLRQRNKNDGHAHILSYTTPSTTGPKYRNNDRIRAHEQSPAARRNPKSTAAKSRKPAVTESWPVVHTHVSYHTLMPAGLKEPASHSASPVSPQSAHMGQRHFVAGDHAVWCCLPLYELQREMRVRLGEAGSPRAIENPRVWRLERMSWVERSQ